MSLKNARTLSSINEEAKIKGPIAPSLELLANMLEMAKNQLNCFLIVSISFSKGVEATLSLKIYVSKVVVRFGMSTAFEI